MEGVEFDTFHQIESGIVLTKEIMKAIKKPVDNDAKKQMDDGLKLLMKKIKLIKKDEQLRVQYLDRVAFDTIQAVFQALHLFIISTDGSNDYIIEDAATWLREHENVYQIAERMQKAANARADFNGAPKKV